jgi:hypothetical protein
MLMIRRNLVFASVSRRLSVVGHARRFHGRQYAPIRLFSSEKDLQDQGSLVQQREVLPSGEEKKVPSFIKDGDWLCGRCQSHNFGRRLICFECQAKRVDGRNFYTKGSWFCQKCEVPIRGNHHSLGRLTIDEHSNCRRCGASKEDGALFPLSERDVGDSSTVQSLMIEIPPFEHEVRSRRNWACTNCQFENRGSLLISVMLTS